ncbi:MAG: glycosyltransferase, partial [Acidimicrobiales bacterium]
YNGFDIDPPPGDRSATRKWLEVDDDQILVAHPVRAIARKNIPKAIELSERLGGVYWLTGPAEEGYDDELADLVAKARCPVLQTPIRDTGFTVSDLYAAADLVAFPSTWEGFGNPPVEAAVHRRPAAVGHYPVADELRALGFHWYDPDDAGTLAAALKGTPDDILERNRQIAREHFSVGNMANEVERLFMDAGWAP